MINSTISSEGVQVKTLASKNPDTLEAGSSPSHWVGNPPTSFRNPWPSFTEVKGLTDVLYMRFGPNRNFVPVPETREELVTVRKPDWGHSHDGWERGLKATWLGHAGFLVETGCSDLAESGKHSSIAEGSAKSTTTSTTADSTLRGVRILFDTVFSERTSPVTFLGPKRYTPTPCSLEELPDVDVIATSHDHYDHMDLVTIRKICAQQAARGGPRPRFFAGLGNATHLLGAGAGIRADEIVECDWWDSAEVTVPGVGTVELTCTPTQHFSGRGIFDRARSLWCSWCVVDPASGTKLFFAGDTAYKAHDAPSVCPVFKQIGEVFGSFDLALLPIGLFTPREFMGNVHCAPDDSLEIHKDIRSKKSIGMHYGTVRGGLSMYYEDVRDPPRRWKEVCEKEGKWGECGLCDVGETVMVSNRTAKSDP